MTSLPIIANVSRVVTRVVDRITGDRSDYPLLVSLACVEALKRFDIKSQIMFGQAAWLEVLEDQSVIWAGCWGDNTSFWVATSSGETIDLNTSVAFKKRAHSNPKAKALYSPPILWSKEIPRFYRYIPEGVAEASPTERRDQQWMNVILEEIQLKCTPALLGSETELEFPNEPIICPDKKLLDDTEQTFKHFDRALAIQGIPQAPF